MGDFYLRCWAEPAPESVFPCSVPNSDRRWRVRACSPVPEVELGSETSAGGGAHTLLPGRGSLWAWQCPSHEQQAQETVNYYSFSPQQGSVRNLSHSLCLSACWECLLSFFGATDRNSPLLPVTHLEDKWIDMLVNALTSELAGF